MSVRSGKVCKDCNHCIRERDNYNVIVCRCDVHDMYLSYETVMGGLCKHWEKPKEAEKSGGRVMDNQEAIKWLREAEILDLASGNTKDREAVNKAISALEKRIPKKPKYKEEDRFVKNHFAVYPYCPVCEKEVVAGDMHCVQCGQKICWEEE